MHSHRAVKLILIVLAILLVVVCGALGLIGNFFFNFALNPSSDYSFSAGEGAFSGSAALVDPADNPYIIADAEGWLGESADDLWRERADGTRLHAYFVPQADSHRYAIVCHGYTSQARYMAQPASHFYKLGMNVLMPDAQAHGQSGGDYIGMGWPERLDIVDWIDHLIAQDPLAEILLYGVSMGGATVMMTTGEELPDNVKCAIEDCGYTSVWDEFAGQLKSLYNLPTFPVLNAASLVCQVRAGYSFGEASAVRQVAKSVTPTLFIHGSDDSFVPFWMLDEVYNAAACPKEKLIIPGAGHGTAADTDPATYWTAVDRFVETYFG